MRGHLGAPPRKKVWCPPMKKYGVTRGKKYGVTREKSMGSLHKESMGWYKIISNILRSYKMICTYIYETYPLHGQSGPCKEYVSYMYEHIIIYYPRLFGIVLYHPMLCLGSDPIFFSPANLQGSPKATNMGLPKEKTMGLPREKQMRLPQTLKSDSLRGYPTQT